MNVTHIDFRYVEIEYELWALRQMLDVMEPAIDAIADTSESVVLERLKANGWDADEVELDFAWQDIHELRERVAPRYLRGPFIVALWAGFESGVTSIGHHRAGEIGTGLRLDDIRGRGFLERATRYFDAVLGMPFDTDLDRVARLRSLNTVRNALAHGNGRREGMSEKQWERLLRLVSQSAPRHPAARDGFVVLSREYLEHAFADVSTGLRDLASRAKQDPAKG